MLPFEEEHDFILQKNAENITMSIVDNTLKDLWEDAINKAIDERAKYHINNLLHGMRVALNEMERQFIHSKFIQETKGKEYSKGYNDALQFFKGIVKSLED